MIGNLVVCFIMAFAAVWLLSSWRVALIWAITFLGVVVVQGYLTYVVLAAGAPSTTSL
jgi:hypothetical protein